MLLLAFVAVAALGGLALLSVVFLVKMVLWAVLLPFRILFKLTFGLGGLLVGVIAAPLVLLVVVVGVVVALIGALLAVVLPLLPFVMLALLGWAIYRGATRVSPTPI